VAADETGTSAAICSVLAAEVFGLDILAARIEGEDQNETRFLVLRQWCPADHDFPERTANLIMDEGSRGLIVCRILPGRKLHEVEEAIRLVGFVRLRVYSKEVADSREWIYLFLTGEAEQNEKAAKLITSLEDLVYSMWDWGRWSKTP
jgi:prephenate dehydratase